MNLADVSLENTVKYGLCPRLMRRLYKYGIFTLKDLIELIKVEEFELMFPKYYQRLQVLKAVSRHFDEVQAEKHRRLRLAYRAALREPCNN